MSKILFVTTRNVLNTCGELRLIKNRAKTLFERWGITTDYIVLNSRERIDSKNEDIGSKSTIRIIPLNQYNPVSVYKGFKNAQKLMLEYMKKEKYICIVLSGFGTLSFLSAIKKANKDIPIIGDIHGAREELIEFPKGNLVKRVYRRLMYRYGKYNEKKYISKLNGTFVVSNALAGYLNKEYKLSNFKHYVIPCSLDNEDLDQDTILSNREEYREKYNIKSDEILFVYSGGTSPWQCVDKSIKIFKELRLKYNLKAKMLILSHDISTIKKMINNSKDIISDSVNAEEVNKILCAGDYAFLLRDDYVTNNVAFPNKFLEYVQSGMKIITTPYVYDVARQIEQFDLGIIINLEEDSAEKIASYIIKESKLDDSNARKQLLKKNSFEETLINFVTDFKYKQ